MEPHSCPIGRQHNGVGAEAQGIGFLVGRGRQHRHPGATGSGQLNGHVAQPAQPDYGDVVAGADLPVLQGRPDRNAGAQDRGCLLRRKPGWNGHYERIANNQVGRVAAVGVEPAAVGHQVAVVGTSPANGPFAVLLVAFPARRAVTAGVDHTTHAHQIAGGNLGNVGARFDYPAHHLVAGHAGVNRVLPVVANLVQIGVANATVEHLDQHLIGRRWLPFDLHGGKRIGCIGGRTGRAVGLDEERFHGPKMGHPTG